MSNKKNNNKFEIIDGAKYINGYLCNEAGQPITVSNGYSEEDEKYAKRAYKTAKDFMFENLNQQDKTA